MRPSSPGSRRRWSRSWLRSGRFRRCSRGASRWRPGGWRGVGGLTGHLLVSTVVGGGLHVADEAVGADVVADADRSAKGIAKQLAALFAKQGWTS